MCAKLFLYLRRKKNRTRKTNALSKAETQKITCNTNCKENTVDALKRIKCCIHEKFHVAGNDGENKGNEHYGK